MKCAVYVVNIGFLLLSAFFQESHARAAADDQCAMKFKADYYVNETTPIGTGIVEIPAFPRVSWTMKISYDLFPIDVYGQLDSFFLLQQQAGNNNYVLTVNEDLDLEEIYKKLGTNVIQLLLTCTETGRQGQTQAVFIQIGPVNEYSPEFIDAPFIVNVSESEAVGFIILLLSNHARDLDVRPSTSEIYAYSLEPYDFARFGVRREDDGRDYFTMANPLTGSLETVFRLDYEKLAYDKRSTMWLNATVTDHAGNTEWTTVQVNVLDADDLSPEFYVKGDCQPQPLKYPPCDVAYTARVLRNTTGKVDQIEPAPIYAHDRDTLDNPVRYTLRDSPGARGVANHLRLDEVTGVLTVVRPFLDVKMYSLYVEARETAGNRFKASANLVVDVYSPTQESTTKPALISEGGGLNSVGGGPSSMTGSRHEDEDEDSDDNSESVDKVSIIGMAVLGVLALALLVALFVTYLKLRKLRQARVGSAYTSTRSTKSLVNDEEPPSTSSPVLQQKRQEDNLPVPGERGNKLPPLNTDMFDGKRSFEKEVNFDFFKTPGKVKVPLAPSGDQTTMTEPIYIEDDDDAISV